MTDPMIPVTGLYTPESTLSPNLDERIADYKNQVISENSNDEFQKTLIDGQSITDLMNQAQAYQDAAGNLLAEGNPDLGYGRPGQSFSMDNVLQKANEFANPKTASIYASGKAMDIGPAKDLDRYTSSEDFQTFGYNPLIGQEQEFQYGRAMTWGDTIGKALGGGSSLAYDTFVEGWKGWGRMADALFSWDASKLMGSPEEMYEMAKRQEEVLNKYAIYDTETSKDGIFNRQFFGTMLQQSGFAVGAGLQFVMENYLTAGLGSLASGAMKGVALARGIKTAGNVGELINDTRKVMNVVSKTERNVNTLSNLAKTVVPLYGTTTDLMRLHKAGAGAVQLAMAGIGGIKREISMFNMARSESIFEAAGTYKNLKDRLTEEYVSANGAAPDAEAQERINRTAENAAHDNFYTNLGVLSVMNRIQFDNMFKSFNTTRKVFDKGTAEFAEQAFEVSGKVAGKTEKRAFQKGTFGRFSATGEIAEVFGKKTAAWEATKSIGRGLMKFETSEGVQELIQSASDKGLTDYYYDLYHGQQGFSGKMGMVMDSIQNPFTDIEGRKTFLMGALTGRLIAPINSLGSRIMDGKSIAERKEKAKEAISTLNAFYADPTSFKREWIANVKVQDKAAETMDQAAQNRNRYVFYNHKDSAFAKTVSTAIKLNMFESMRDTIGELGAEMNDEEFKKAFGMDATDKSRKDVKLFMGEINSQIDEYYTTYYNLKDKYSDTVIPELYKNNGEKTYETAKLAKVALEDAIEMLTTNVFKAKQAVKRATQLQTEIGQNLNIGASSLEVLTKMGSEQSLALHIAMLNQEIGLASQAEEMSPEQRKLLKEKKEELELAESWKSAYDEIMANDDASYSPATEGRAYKSYAKLLNLFNARNNNQAAISKEEVDDLFIKITDYIKLNRDNKNYVDAMNTIADPFNMKLITESLFSSMQQANEGFKKAHEEEINNEVKEETEEDVTNDPPPPADPEDPSNPPAPPAPADPAEPLEEENPDLEQYLQGVHKTLIEENPDFKTPYDLWRNSGAVNFWKSVYNKKFKAKGKKAGDAMAGDTKEPAAETKDVVDTLSIADTTMKTIAKAIVAVRMVYNKISGDQAMVDKLRAKISEIQDAYSRTTLMNIITPKKADATSGFQPLPNAEANPEHIGFDVRNLSADEFNSGFRLVGDQAILSEVGGQTGSINHGVRVVATREFVKKEQAKVAGYGIENRTMTTFETPKDTKKLFKGESVLAVSSRPFGFGTQVYGMDPKKGNMYVTGIENYAIVHPDNTTEPVTFSEEQRSFVKKNMLVNGNPMTDKDFNHLQSLHRKMQAYNLEVEAELADKDQADVTALFNKYFTISRSGFTAETGEALEDTLQRNPEKLFTVEVMDANGNVTSQNLPLIATRKGTAWSFDFPITAGSSIVYTDKESGQLDYATNFNDYLRDVQGINLEMTSSFGGVMAWIAKDPTVERGYKPYSLSKMTGTEPVELFKGFIEEFNKLRASIAKGLEAKEFNYNGTTYATINALMKEFNTKQFGFYKTGDWFADISFNPKSKKFAFELRPADRTMRDNLTENQKQMLNLYFDSKAIAGITAETSDEDVKKIYSTWMKKLVKDLGDMGTKMADSTDPVVKQLRSMLDSKVLFYYEMEGDTKNYLLKLQDKRNTVAPLPFLQYKGSNASNTKIALSFNNNVVAATETKKPKLTTLGVLGDDDFIRKPEAPVASTSTTKTDVFDTPTLKSAASNFEVLYVPRAVVAAAYANDEINQTRTSGPQTLDTIIKRGGYSIEELNKLLPNWRKMTAATPAATTKKKTIKKKITEDDDPFMLEQESGLKKYTAESFAAEIQWLNTALKNSGVQVQDLATILHSLRAGKAVLGYYKDQAIYVNQKLSAEGAIYHEAFHGLFRNILSAEQRAFYTARAKAKMGTVNAEKINQFRSDRGYTNKTDAQILDLMAEEVLADGFRDFKLKKQEPGESWFKRFVRILERILTFFNSNAASIDNLYKDFDGGKFANRKFQASTIAEEGVYSIAYGRPKLYLETDPDSGEQSFTADMRPRPMNIDLQNELVNKIAHAIATTPTGTFTEKFNEAVEDIAGQYFIETIIPDGATPEQIQAIKNRYQDQFNEALYVLGYSVPYELDDAIATDPDAIELRLETNEGQASLDIIKRDVQSKIDTLGIATYLDENFELPVSDEDRAEKEKGGEFDTIHMNPLQGLSTEFRNLFSMIPYTYEDRDLGVQIQKMADGAMLFNAMIKVASDTSVENIIPSLAKAVETLEEDNDPKTAPLVAFAEFLAAQFGIADISDPASKPTRNIHLYKQFIDTFFVTELPSYVIKATTTGSTTKAEIFDASINQDIDNKKEAVKFFFENAYRKLSTPEEIAQFTKDFDKLKEYIVGSLFKNLDSPLMSNRKSLNKIVDEVKVLLDNVNIVLPKGLIRQSFLAIYTIENKKELNANSKQSINDLQVDQRLMREGAYLTGNFWNFLSQMTPANYSKIFADTKTDSVNVGSDYKRINGLNAIMKKSMKYVIKYDINSAISVFQNAENKNIWRYSRYTPPVLLAQLVREKGVGALTEFYPILSQWLGDNELFDGSAENELYLENLFISAFGGIRQEIGDEARQGVTFGSIDTKSLLLSGIVNFMNRQTITKTVKEDGKSKNVQITTFQRSRTQEEATTTNFLVTAKYQNYLNESKRPTKAFTDKMVSMLGQEYNRISREWARRADTDVVRYNQYNNNVHPVTGLPIEGDTYVVDNKTVKLRAYQFKNFEHFFDEQKTTEQNKEAREAMKNRLRDLAKQGVSFEEALQDEALAGITEQLGDYMLETYAPYEESLKKNGLLQYDDNKKANISKLIPGTIKLDNVSDKLQAYGYETIEDMLMDHHLNIFMNKMQVNQIFDGDIATGIKSSVEYYKRNKSGVISGNSMKTGFFRTAVVENIQAEINMDDLVELTGDNLGTEGKTLVDTADGQSYHTMNHRIRMMDSWGRVDSEVRALLNAYKYRPLTTEEIEALEERKVVLNTIKTATGGVLEYYKLSEHLISRVDVSHLVIPKGMKQDEVYNNLDILYNQIEMLEDRIVENPNAEDAGTIAEELTDLYNQVHQYWTPKRSREKMHHMLNSMEIHGIDQLFDPNASKKTTVVPVKLSADGISNLSASKSVTPGLFKFMQVETSGIKDRITLPTQARQLLTTYLTRLDNDKVFGNKSLAELAGEYSKTLGAISKSNLNTLERTLLGQDGKVNLVDLFTQMRNGLKMQGADSNTLKFFDIKDGQPVHNPNLPAIKKIFTYYYFAMFNDTVFSEQVSGRSDILVSSYGYEVLYDVETGKIITTAEQNASPATYANKEKYKTRHLGVSVEKVDGKNVYTIEAMIPEPLANNAALRELYLNKLSTFFSTRIPTEDKRSMIVIKVVDYLDAAYRNSIIVPQAVHILAGSDLDVDKLYSHTFDFYSDFKETPHVYGDYSNYETESQGRFAEYVQYMLRQPSLRDALAVEIEKVTAAPVLHNDFLKIKEELGVDNMEYNAEELKDLRQQNRDKMEAAKQRKAELMLKHNLAFDSYMFALEQDRNVDESRASWKKEQTRYLAAKTELNEIYDTLKSLRKTQKILDNTIKLVALTNVLKAKKMPITQAELTKFLKTNPTPVVPVLQNESLQQKIDILSNEKVFNSFYIEERSSVEEFRTVAQSIGAAVEDVVKENSIYSVMGDVVANNLNSSNKDGIGISASFNKFLAFAEKTGLSLPFDLINLVDAEGQQTSYNDFTNTTGIRKIGQTLGMFADAAKDPIPSVLNLNPITAGISNVINGMTSNLELGLLINKVPAFEKAAEAVAVSRSAVQTNDSLFGVSLGGIIKDSVIAPGIEMLAEAQRLNEIWNQDKEGKVIPNDYRTFYINKTEPNPDFVNLPENEKDLAALGIELQYEDGSVITGDAAMVLLANMYVSINQLNGDIIRLGNILNLIKDLKPEFAILDRTLSDINYFMQGDSVFKDEIAKILKSSAEYGPLMEAAAKMSEISKELLIERSPLFKNINAMLLQGFNNTKGDFKIRQNISDQIGKFIIINKVKAGMRTEIEALKDATTPNKIREREMLQEASKYFTSDFWVNNNSFVEDLDYLYNSNPGNPFVQFIRTNSRKNLTFLEASTRMKLDKDITENIINGYEALQKSLDDRTRKLSSQMFYYLLVKDGLGYGANTFIKYINPELKQFKVISDSLTDFQGMLAAQESFINKKMNEYAKVMQSGIKESDKQAQVAKMAEEVYANYSKLFDQFFNNTTRPGKVDWISGMLSKIFAYAGNQSYIRPVMKSEITKENKDKVLELFSNGVVDHITKDTRLTNKFDWLQTAGKKVMVDFSTIANSQPLVSTAETVFRNFFFRYDMTGAFSDVSFPVLLQNGDGRLFRLVSVDGTNIANKIAMASLSRTLIEATGIQAEYIEIEIEGSANLLNLGFTPEDGRAIYKATLPEETDDDLYNMGVRSEMVPKKTTRSSNLSVVERSGPVDPSGFTMIDEDDIEFGSYKKKNAGTKTAAEPDDSIGSQSIGGISVMEINRLYKERQLGVNKNKLSIEQFRTEALKFVDTLSKAGKTKEQILEQIKCL